MPELNFSRRAIRIPFGKHKDEFLSELGLDYLLWAEEHNIFPSIQFDITDEIKRRRSGRSSVGKIIKRGK